MTLQAEAVIDATFRDMKATLENRRAELVMDVRKLSNERATMLANQQRNLERALSQCESLRDAMATMMRRQAEMSLAGPIDCPTEMAYELNTVLKTTSELRPACGDGLCIDLDAASLLPELLGSTSVSATGEGSPSPAKPKKAALAKSAKLDLSVEEETRRRGFDPRLCHSDLLLSNENLTLRMTSSPKWATAMGPRLVDQGQHFWFVRLDSSSNVMIGVAVDSCMLVDTHEEQRAWFFYCHTGYKYHAGDGLPYGGKCEQGDVVGVLYDADAHHLAFYKNAVYLGVAYNNLPPNVRPAVSLYEEKSQLTVDFGSDGVSTAFVKNDAPNVFPKAEVPRKTELITAVNRKRAARAEAAHPAEPDYSFHPKISREARKFAENAPEYRADLPVGERVYNKGLESQKWQAHRRESKEQMLQRKQQLEKQQRMKLGMKGGGPGGGGGQRARSPAAGGIRTADKRTPTKAGSKGPVRAKSAGRVRAAASKP